MYLYTVDNDPAWMSKTIKKKIEAKMHSTKNIFRKKDLKVTSFFLKI